MAEMIRTDDVLTPSHLMQLFATGTDGDDYDGPDLDEVSTVQVCDGVWMLEPDGELWRFWRWPGIRTGAAMAERRSYASEGVHKGVPARGDRVRLACADRKPVDLSVRYWSSNSEFVTCRLCRELLGLNQRKRRHAG